MVTRAVREGWLRRAAPGVVLLVIMLVDHLNDPVPLVGVIVIAPLFAANVVGPRLTAAYAAAALVAAVVLGYDDGQYARPDLLRAQNWRLVLVAFGGALAVVAAADRVRRERRLADVLRVADVAQRAVLPDVPDRIGPVRLAADYQSADREASLGGDLYAALPTPHGVRLLIGDVRGKGLDAVRLASVLLGAFRERAHERADLCTLASDLDRAVSRVADAEDFVTVVLAQVDDDGCLTVVNAGHPPPLLLRNGRVQQVRPPDDRPPLGLDGSPVARTVQLAAGDRLLFYTDGLTEARSADHRVFFPAERFLQATLGTGSLTDGMSALRSALIRWTGGHLPDDVALLAMEVPEPSAAAL